MHENSTWRLPWHQVYNGHTTWSTFTLYYSYLRATSHTRLRAHDHCTSSTIAGGKVEPVQVHCTLCLRDQYNKCMHDESNVYMDSYMASKDHVSWSLGLLSKTTSWEVDLTQNRETMALWSLTIINLLHSNLCEDPVWTNVGPITKFCDTNLVPISDFLWNFSPVGSQVSQESYFYKYMEWVWVSIL